MRHLLAGLVLLAFSPVIIAIAWLVRRMLNAKPNPGEPYPYDDDDPGVDVDCPAGEQVCEPVCAMCGGTGLTLGMPPCPCKRGESDAEG
jgi:hypothetical protein